MVTVVVRALSMVLFLVAARGVAAVETHPAETRGVNLFADSQRPDQAIISTRSLAGASVLRQSSRERVALTIAALVLPPTVEACRFSPASRTILVQPHLPFCITPRPPPPASAF
jgi:hypothetical protein